MDIAAVFHSAGDVSVLSAQSDLRCAPVRLRTQSILSSAFLRPDCSRIYTLFLSVSPLLLLPHLRAQIPEKYKNTVFRVIHR